jgi:hypothetical protein
MPRKSNSNNNNNSDYTQNNNSNSNCTSETCSSWFHEDIREFLEEMKLNNSNSNSNSTKNNNNNSLQQRPQLNASQVDKIINVLSIVTRQPNLSTLEPINVESLRSVSKNIRASIPEQNKADIMVSGLERVFNSYKGKSNTEIRKKLLILMKKLDEDDILELLFGDNTRHLINLKEPHILYVIQMVVSYFEPKNEIVKKFLDTLSKEEVKKLCYTRCQRGATIYYRACQGS